MQAMLIESFGFPPNSIKVLIDVGQGEKPTGKAIKQHLAAVVQACKPGDVLFVHFSGHGTQVADKNADDADKKDEAIVPTDLNIITDDDLRAILGKLPANVRLTMVCCPHTAALIQLRGHLRTSGALYEELRLKILSRRFISCALVLI
jgi:hypothetical protein